jgi:hypothetical protein
MKANIENEKNVSTDITAMSYKDMDPAEIRELQWDGIDHRDAPDYCDAYVMDATYMGEDLTEEQLDELNDDRDFVYERLMDYLN